MRTADAVSCSAVLFDLDGTLIDSEPNYQAADGRFLAEYGIPVDEDLRRRMLGRGSDEIIRMLRDEHGVTEDPAALLYRKDDYYLELARGGTRVFPEMLRLLDILGDMGLPLAVASGSSLRVIREMLELCGIRDRFLAAVSSEETPRDKPAPDVFLEAARRIGVPPGSCLALEDSAAGVEAALAAGIRVFAIPTIITPPLPEPFHRAHRLWPQGMRSFRAEDFLAGVRRT